ncbi:MAG: hypothetical protein MJ193_00675 [Clostridia bacterium]|nr:hypothetical protein [Clostridia bacterium]
MLTALKISFLYIGTAIGAGFSSGKEIALFFGETSPYSAMLAGVFIAILCLLFLVAGKVSAIPQNFAVKTATFICACISLFSMLAGGEFILENLSGIPLLSLLMAVVGGIVVILGIEKIKIANSILIPLLIAFLIVIYIKIGTPVFQKPFSILKPIRYAGLDVLLGGIMLSREGKKLTYKQIFLSAIGVAISMSIILFILQNTVLSVENNSTMPVFDISKTVGLEVIAGILIAIAIFTTLISALDIVTDYTADFLVSKGKMKPSFSSRAIIVFGALTLFYPVSFLGFENIVNFFYPFVSMTGIVLVVWTAISLLVAFVKNKKEHSNTLCPDKNLS